MIRITVTPDPIEPFVADAPRPDAGAELVFHGRVRGTEASRDVVALDYEQYEGMARSELETLAGECLARFGLLDLACTHRVGEVRVGEASLRVVIRSRHREEGIAALDWFVRELKIRVPIWKWGITPLGERFPTQGPEPRASNSGDS
jgi:molybdopterin synthase catalytic subunit